MKAFLSLAVAASISLSEALIYNKTAAYAPGNYEKYKCITTEDINDMFPACLRQCQRDANSQDGCAYNDFACHCANYDVYSPLVEECAFPPELGGTGNCTLPELGQARQVVTDLCNFFNATGYTASAECGHGWCGGEEKHGGWDGRKGGWGGRRGGRHGGWGGKGGPRDTADGCYDLSPEMTFNLIAEQDITISY
ncbi:hypothetical protein KC332_g1070 [Hortaea werneckii]|uniref:CFEM domain-containing protein n=2 Tax=Hortaea werneckii TaxID=91943 RepID=A0A3M7INZ3_HORWE|nr:hypothetical protein KC358_g999 [Hortaea werneckii]OTA32502.1 hypothetical protein BTJ68_08311 [Hortaea werneckii EXF-2000]KAI6852321.1 hypothetical protein KC350_g1003 [Hortaea werneckii]KAI6944185.1 hypothetical protein KC341_g981 [Hortaea werneckii]KAI6945547.1 hypothetical protein KC348_g3749 [Hortaea werneckii]